MTEMFDSMTDLEYETLLDLHKEATLGRLVAGLLHEFRNPLNSIVNSGQLLEEMGEQVAMRDKLLPVIARSSGRVQNLLDAIDQHRQEAHGSGPLDLHQALQSCGVVLAHALRLVKYHPSGVSDEACVLGPPELVWFVLLSVLEISLHHGAKNLWVRSRVQDGTRRMQIESDGDCFCEKGTSLNLSARLGLRLSGMLVTRMGGELACEPREATGCILTLSLLVHT